MKLELVWQLWRDVALMALVVGVEAWVALVLGVEAWVALVATSVIVVDMLLCMWQQS